MNDTFIEIEEPESPKTVAGDGDGIKFGTPRCAVPSWRKFTASAKKNKDMKLKLELALNEMQKQPRTAQSKRKEDSASVNIPRKNSKKKNPKDVKDNLDVTLYATPRGTGTNDGVLLEASRIIFKYFLLNSWRKCKERLKEFSQLMSNKDEKIKQLNMQLDVLQNLRKSQSSRVDEIVIKYQEIQKENDSLFHENTDLRDRNEELNNEIKDIKENLKKLEEELRNNEDECEQKENALKMLKRKYEKETLKVRRYMVEKKIALDQNHKLDSMLNIQKENLQNATKYIENLQTSKRCLEEIVEKLEQTRKDLTEELENKITVIETLRSKISDYENERAAIVTELKQVKSNLDVVQNDYSQLETKNETIYKEIADISLKMEIEEKNSSWNVMRKGMFSTYKTLRYLAKLMIPILQSNYKF